MYLVLHKFKGNLQKLQTKGQLISKGNFLVSPNLPKKQRIILRISALASKMGQIKKIKALLLY